MIDLSSYGFADEYQQVFDTVYRFSREELHPLNDRMDRDDWFPEERFRSLADVGLLGMTVPEEFGGQGTGFPGAMRRRRSHGVLEPLILRSLALQREYLRP